MNKEELIERTAGDFEDADIQAALDGRVLVKNMDLCKVFVQNIRHAKKSIKCLNRAGISTVPVQYALASLRSELKSREKIVLALKQRYHEACEHKYFCKKLAEQLSEDGQGEG